MRSTEKPSILSRVSAAMPWVSILSVAVVLFGLRAKLVSIPLSEEISCDSCLVKLQLLEDLPLILLALCAYALSRFLKTRAWVVPLRLFTLAIGIVYLLDLAIYRNFFVRLDLRDVVVYGQQFDVVWRQLLHAAGRTVVYGTGAMLAAIVLGCVLIRPARSVVAKRVAVVLAVALLVAQSARMMLPYESPSIWAIRNVIAHNMTDGASAAYSDDMQAQIEQRLAGGPASCLAGSARRPNIVVLIAESWSPYHSRLFSGLNDWTPRLDDLARQGRYYPNFHAGGSNTNAGLVSLLLGRPIYSPIKAPLQLGPFEGAWSPDSSLPKVMGILGYETVFMTNGNLAFSDKGKWLASIGFSDISGHDAPEYDGLPRLAFDAPADDHLYRKALARLQQQDRDKPRLLVLENVSTHHPYVHPYTLESGERAVFEYMDQSMGEFVRRLAQSGFLDENVLVVVSDHRAMTMVSGAERRMFGMAAGARIPAFVLSGLVPAGRDDTPFHQADLFASLAALVSDGACTQRKTADIFGFTPTPPRCLFHAPMSDWNSVHAYCGRAQARIRLKGDDSRVEWVVGRDAEADLLMETAMRRLSMKYSDVLPGTRRQAKVAAPVAPLALRRWTPDAARAHGGATIVAAAPSRRHRDCNIEFINGRPMEGTVPELDPFADLVVSGWVSDPKAKNSAPDARLLLRERSTGRLWRLPALRRSPRPDVVDAREAPWLSDSGFLARVPLELLAPGEYALTLAHGDGALAAACGEVAFRLSAPARTAVAVE